MIPKVLKEALPALEEVITGLMMVKGEVQAEGDELKDIVDVPIEEGFLVEVSVEGKEGKGALFFDKKDVAALAGKILGMESEELTDELKDAFSEFMNQFWGRLRMEFTQYQEDFNFTQPESSECSREDLLLKGYSKFFPVKIKVEDSEVTAYFLLDDALEAVFNEMDTTEVKEEKAEVIPQPEAQPQKDMVKISSEKLDLILDIELPVAVSLGKARMKIKDVLKLGPGSLIELDRSADDYVDLVVNGKVIARGEVVVVESNFAFRIREIVSKAERLKGLSR